jgi:hypothetical protein
MQSKVKSFREIVESKKPGDDYEPLMLWLIPFYLRTRQQYYDEAASKIKKYIDDLWNKVSDTFYTRDEFEKSTVLESIWDSYTPYWWGLNDVIGWIDVRLCVRHRQIQLSLFLPSKRVSRKLKDKMFAFQDSEIIDLPDIATNNDLQNKVIEALHIIIQDPRIKRFFIDLEPWYRIIRHTDLVGIIQEFAHDDWEKISYENNTG